MSPSLPPVSGNKVIHALERLGFTVRRQRGSHVVMRRGASGCVVPAHPEIKRGRWLVLKQAGVSREEFLTALTET